LVANRRRMPTRLSHCRRLLQQSLGLGWMGPIIWPSRAHRGATRPANRCQARRRQPRSFSPVGGGSVPEARASNLSLQAGGVDGPVGQPVFRQHAEGAAAAGAAKALNARAPRAVAVRIALITAVPMKPLRGICRTRRPRSLKTAFSELHRLEPSRHAATGSSRQNAKPSFCQITPGPPCQCPRNKLSLHQPRSHEIAWRGTPLSMPKKLTRQRLTAPGG
jgi:hypothetical protein